MNKTESIIERANSYMKLLRFQYTELEQLSRYTILNDYYNSKNESPTVEKFSFKVESAESLSKDLTLPLKVRGVFLTEGRPAKKFYLAEELQKAVKNPLNQRFPLMLDHEDSKAGKIVGVVEKLEYDPVIKGIRWYGHINDETFARNVLDKVITQVSATIFSANEVSETLGIVAKDLVFKELSLVMQGAEPNNSIEAY